MLWDSYLFLGVNTVLDFWDLLFVVISCNHAQCRGLGTYFCLYIHHYNLIIVSLLSGPLHRTLRAASSTQVTYIIH